MERIESNTARVGQSPGFSFSGMVDTSRSRLSTLNNEAVKYLEQGKIEEARKLFTAILNEDEKNVHALHGVGVVAREMGRPKVAIELMKKALECDPRNAMIACNLGTIYEAEKDYEEALSWYKNSLKWGGKRLKAEGQDGIIHNNIGSVLSKLGRRTEALVSLRRALEVGVEFPEALTNIATMLADLGEFKQANGYYRRALELDPENAHAHHNFGSNLLRQGGWEEGWFHSEWRMVATNNGKPWRRFPQPLWNGQPFHGARVILYAEQGIGDEIRFASMVPEAIARGGEVVVECAPRLVNLFQRSFPEVRVVPSPYWPAEEGVEPFDIACPFGTLGRLFRPNKEAFPVHSGYLKPDPYFVELFRERLKEAGPGPYIGLCWRSGLGGAYRSEYYSGVEDMHTLLKIEGVTFVNLQYDARDDELEFMKSEFGVDLVRWDDVDLKIELEKAAGLTSCMDLVVSPATSVSTMSGALGVETIEFRPFPVPESYFKNGRCPWFPSVRYFSKRQSEKWSKVLRKIATEIEALKP
ncbi:tetratricopeptide repeat protein [Nisaea acidiphila]|uniref:Tetratricopeptide repeat protein n=1 Tax=Nisaea acidiphila TaxID=1862145 RepID=A0A9J7ATL8_9PROT|nr:tetratricopeptide repeat protein [Nisaea acidiphila]UUX50510.1 tetratricopeptide repeat protein [Nisaea acidiphila]